MMQRSSERNPIRARSRLGIPLFVLGVFLLRPDTCLAQGPQFDVSDPPGAPEARGRLGAALGASGTSGFDSTPVVSQPSFIGGRPGPSSTRAPIDQLSNPQPAVMAIQPIQRVISREPEKIPRMGDLELPENEAETGPPDGLTLDAAIEILVHKNINLLALKYEVPMAEADILTASLRNNPIFYADSQLVPYGHFSNQRPGGQTQYDVNVTLPLDVWRKRGARTVVARQAKKVTESQLQDAFRLQIDNLYTTYVDSVAAEISLDFSKRYGDGLRKLLSLNEQLGDAGFIRPADILAIKARLELAELQIRESEQLLKKTHRTIALLLDLTADQTKTLRLRSNLYINKPLPMNTEQLVATGLNNRPDLQSFRFGLSRAKADIQLAKANRYSDVYLLLQPYTFQNNSYQGLKSAYSYAIGATVALPLFNRNQGNLRRTELNAEQSVYELANIEKQVVYDVEEAVREYDLSRESVVEYRKQILPASKTVRDTAFNLWKGGDTNAITYLEAQQEYNDVVRQYRDALVRHRRSTLDLNTAVGVRILP